MSAVRIPVLGIVGGIGSGKSALASALSRHFRCARLDADQIGHRVLHQPEIIRRLREEFGDGIIDPLGHISRSELARRVFGPGLEQQKARKVLESIVHPPIRLQLIDQLDQVQRSDQYELVILDAALLFESGWSNDCDAVIFLDVPVEVRRERVVSRGWSAADLASREASQMTLEEKQKRSDLILNNNRDIETVAAEAAEWIRQRFSLPQPTESVTMTS